MRTENLSDFDSIFYNVKSGDSLSRIVNKYYGNVGLAKQQSIINNILANNPEIKNSNIIYPNQTLLIDIPKRYSPAPGIPRLSPIKTDEEVARALKQHMDKMSPQEKNMMAALAPLMLGTGASGMTMVDKTFQTNAPLIAKIAELYNDFKAGKITRGQYDYGRRKVINLLQQKLGPTNLLLNGSRAPNEVLRISRKNNTVPTQVLTREVNRMANLSKLASRGSAILSVAGLGVACYEIANTDNKPKKNEIFVESLGALGGGLLYGAATTVTILFMATPVGWTAALLIGIGSVAAGAIGSSILKNTYDTYGNNYDIATASGVSRLCKK